MTASSQALFVGLDLGGTTISCAAATREGRIVHEENVPTESHLGPEGVIQRMIALVRQASSAKPAGIGIGVPGLVDMQRGVTHFLPNLPTQWRGVPVIDRMQQALGCPVGLLNDARCAALGELRFGRGRAHPSATMVYYTLGTGVGGAVVIDGKLRLGPLGAAGELGHQTIQRDGLPCGCGNVGCLETLASAPAISGEGVRLIRCGQAALLHQLVQGNADRVNPKTIAEAARAGDPDCQRLIERVADYLGIGLANLVVALHPEMIVFAGGVAEMGEQLFTPLRSALKRRVHMLPVEDIQLLHSQIGRNAGVLGGVALAIDVAEKAGQA